MREEFTRVAREHFPTTKTTGKEYLDEVVTLGFSMDLDFLNMVMNEALRFEGPAQMSTPVYLKKNLKLGKYNF